MYGIWRFLLCLAVAHGHLHGQWWAAGYAVFSFYMLSGYFSTLVLNEKYGYSLSGFRYFILNRVLRLYPAYYLSAIVSILLILALPEGFVHAFHPNIKLPSDFTSTLLNLFIVGLGDNTDIRLVPPAWALSIIILHYFILGMGLAKSKKLILFWLFLSIIYHVVTFLYARFYWRYFNVMGASLPFAMGSFLYHYSPRLKKSIPCFGIKTLSLIYVFFFVFIWRFYPFDKLTFPFYLNLIITFLIILSLSTPSANKLRTNFDIWLDKLSFPVFLVHWQVGLIVSYYTGLPLKSLKLFIASFPFIILVSMIIAKITEIVIVPYRANISKKASMRIKK